MIWDKGDAGFSMVELLVATAITSFVALAAGGLLALGSQARDRVDASLGIQARLVDLVSLASLEAREIGVSIGEAGASSFTLVRGKERWVLGLETAQSEPAIVLRVGDQENRVDLSPFEEVRLEYLIHGQEGGSWSAAPAIATKEVLAARLRLEQGARVWRPLIWSASEWPTVVP